VEDFGTRLCTFSENSGTSLDFCIEFHKAVDRAIHKNSFDVYS
jgi:hypothetical protein